MRDVLTPDVMKSYSEYLIGATMAPKPTYPINDAIIGVNSIAGGVNAFNFMWTAPAGLSAAGYRFDVAVFMDELGVVPVIATPAPTPAALFTVFDSGTGAINSTIVGGAGVPFIGVPGTTYYWRVRVAAGFPLQSAWSAMQKFSIQQLASIVPSLGAPANGGEINTTNPSFSWSPISGVTSYDFMLDTGTSFAAPLYHATAFGGGLDLPVSIQLEAGRTYFWRVRTLTPNIGEWSTIGNFTVASEEIAEPTTTISTVITTNVTNTTITIPQPTTTILTLPQTTQTVNEVNPTYIWAIIIIGAVLVLAVIVLIVRTRRSV